MSVPLEADGALLDMARNAPAIEIARLAPPGSLLLLVPHADDETLGCGMALAAAARLGRPILAVLLTDGEASHPCSPSVSPAQLRSLRHAEFRQALAALTGSTGAAVERLGLPDGCSTPQHLSEERFADLLRLAREHEVASIWTTWRHDPHCDHQTAAALGTRLATATGAQLWEFAVWGRFGHAAGMPAAVWRFDAREHASAKQEAIRVYRSQFTQLISDDPTAFIMPPALLAHFAQAPELFIRD